MLIFSVRRYSWTILRPHEAVWSRRPSCQHQVSIPGRLRGQRVLQYRGRYFSSYLRPTRLCIVFQFSTRRYFSASCICGHWRCATRRLCSCYVVTTSADISQNTLPSSKNVSSLSKRVMKFYVNALRQAKSSTLRMFTMPAWKPLIASPWQLWWTSNSSACTEDWVRRSTRWMILEGWVSWSLSCCQWDFREEPPFYLLWE